MPDRQLTLVPPAAGVVVAVHRSPIHAVSKDTRGDITLVVDHGVEGDTHAGVTVQHRSRFDGARGSRTSVRCTSCTASCTTSCAKRASTSRLVSWGRT